MRTQQTSAAPELAAPPAAFLPLYYFKDLSAAAQTRVINSERESYDFTHDQDFIIEDFTAQLENIGYYDIKIYYSGFNSQGDGASFSARYQYEKGAYKKLLDYSPNDAEFLDIAARLQKLQKRFFYQLRATITQNGRYYHEETMLYSVLNYNAHEVLEFDCEDFTQICEHLARLIYKRLESAYYYQIQEDTIRERLENDDFTTYTKEGKEI